MRRIFTKPKKKKIGKEIGIFGWVGNVRVQPRRPTQHSEFSTPGHCLIYPPFSPGDTGHGIFLGSLWIIQALNRWLAQASSLHTILYIYSTRLPLFFSYSISLSAADSLFAKLLACNMKLSSIFLAISVSGLIFSSAKGRFQKKCLWVCAKSKICNTRHTALNEEDGRTSGFMRGRGLVH